MKKKTSLYEDLAIDKKATPDQIKKAYRQKAKQTHPDNGGKPDEFRTIARAYNILSMAGVPCDRTVCEDFKIRDRKPLKQQWAKI